MTIQALIESSKVVFAVGLDDKLAGMDGYLFAAPRPLCGKEHNIGEYLYGRFLSEIDPEEYGAAGFIKNNLELDARLVLKATCVELLEICYQNHKYADRYRELPVSEQFRMLSHKINDLHHMAYPEAIQRLGLARQKLAANQP